jgi:hypothetical protein
MNNSLILAISVISGIGTIATYAKIRKLRKDKKVLPSVDDEGSASRNYDEEYKFLNANATQNTVDNCDMGHEVVIKEMGIKKEWISGNHKFTKYAFERSCRNENNI